MEIDIGANATVVARTRSTRRPRFIEQLCQSGSTFKRVTPVYPFNTIRQT